MKPENCLFIRLKVYELLRKSKTYFVFVKSNNKWAAGIPVAGTGNMVTNHNLTLDLS
jgi:hypothetical protein